MHYNTQSIVEKENTATVAHSLTDKHTCISIYRQKQAGLPVYNTATWKRNQFAFGRIRYTLLIIWKILLPKKARSPTKCQTLCF